MLPLLAAAIYLMLDEIHALKARNDHDAESTARNVTRIIDGRLATQIAALQVLAKSPLADDGSRLAGLYQEAQGLRHNLGAHVIFADLTMQMLFNTRMPLGKPLPKLPRPSGHSAVVIALETGKPAAGDMFPGPIAKEPLVAVTVPVVRDGKTRFLLLSIFETRQFQDLLDTFALPHEWTVTLLDGKNEAMAARAPTGSAPATGTAAREGRFVSASALAPWSVVLDVPPIIYRAPVLTAALTLAAGLIVATLIGLVGAAVMGRRLARAVATLAEPESPSGKPSGIAEIEDARRALAAAAAARDAAEEKEQESRRHFRATFEQAAVGIAHVAPDGRFLRVNTRFCEITGRRNEELLHCSFQDITHPDDLDRDVGLAQQLQTGKLDTYAIEKRYILPGKGTSMVWVNLTVSVVRAADGSPDYFVSVIEDISERKALESQLRQAQKMEAVGQLTGGLAHDLNNVLAVISMNVELLRIDATADPKRARHVDAALKGVLRASEMTRKLLDFSRTEAGETQLVSLNGFVTGMEGLIAKTLTPAIALKIAQADDTWVVDVNPGDFEAALLNLALNARDAMPNGGTLVIETANKVIDQHYVSRNPGSSAGEFVMISISDTGMGMAPDVAEKAFEPFFTTKEVGKGTGLGLSMVYGFVRRSGGHVKIYSEVGEGTTIRLYLPRGHQDTEGEERAALNKGGQPRGHETVLVVDDEAGLVEAAVAVLGGLGYRTVSATNGPEALEILRRDRSIELLFSDVIMPGGMDGYHLAIEARKDRPDLKVLLTSGFTRKREEFVNGERKIAAELAKNLLPKPYNIVELAVAVRRMLDRPATTSG